MSQTHAGPDNRSTYRTPLWVKAAGVLVLILVVMVGIMLLSGGQHGPGMHMPPGAAGGHTPAANATEEAAQHP